MTTTKVDNIYKELFQIVSKYLPDKEVASIKKALDFACGKGRNVTNMISLFFQH